MRFLCPKTQSRLHWTHRALSWHRGKLLQVSSFWFFRSQPFYMLLRIFSSKLGDFAITANRRVKTQEFYGLKVYGSCCWKICETRRGRNCEIFGPGAHETPSKFIFRGRMQVCWNKRNFFEGSLLGKILGIPLANLANVASCNLAFKSYNAGGRAFDKQKFNYPPLGQRKKTVVNYPSTSIFFSFAKV